MPPLTQPGDDEHDPTHRPALTQVASKPIKLPSGNWNTQVRLPNGKRKSFTDPLKGQVVAQAREFEAALRRGEAVPTRDRRMTVRAWEAKWTAARNVEKATAAKNASHMRNHLLPRWGDWPLHTIGRLDVQAWIKEMTAAGVGAATARATYNLLSSLLADAVLEGHLGASPCREISLPKVVKPEPRWLTREEYDRIQLALAPEWQAFVGLACFSGLRPGELAGLDVGAIDFERRLARVSQVMTRHGLRAYPKSDTSVRSVPFPPEVGDLLWRLVADRSQGPVFPWKDGGRVDDRDWLRQVWRPALKAAGIAYERPYVMRHTCASWLVQAGVPDRRIMRILGHSNTRLIDVYAHLAPDEHDVVRAAWGSAPEAGDAQATYAEPVEH